MVRIRSRDRRPHRRSDAPRERRELGRRERSRALWPLVEPPPIIAGPRLLHPRRRRGPELRSEGFRSSQREIFDKTGRAQVRAFVRSNSRMVCGNLEVFDSETGRTSIILSLQEVVHRGQRFTRCVGPEKGDEPTKRPFPVHLPNFWSEPGPDSSQCQRIILVEPLVLNHDRSPERWNGCAIDVSVPCGIPGGSLHRWIEVGAIDGLDSKSRRRRNRRRILRHP